MGRIDGWALVGDVALAVAGGQKKKKKKKKTRWMAECWLDSTVFSNLSRSCHLQVITLRVGFNNADLLQPMEPVSKGFGLLRNFSMSFLISSASNSSQSKSLELFSWRQGATAPFALSTAGQHLLISDHLGSLLKGSSAVTTFSGYASSRY